MELTQDKLLSSNFMGLKLASAAYVLALILAHIQMPWAVWPVAVFFSVAMNFTYPWAALVQRTGVNTEVVMSLCLIGLSLLGLWQPLFVIAAIFFHGCWDMAKHHGHGTPFFGWYISGCVIVDWIYSSALILYWGYV